MTGLANALVMLGLAATGGGAWIAARSIFLTEESAEEIAKTYYGHNKEFKKSLIRQSEAARNGLYLIVVGTALQLIGTFAGVIA